MSNAESMFGNSHPMDTPFKKFEPPTRYTWNEAHDPHRIGSQAILPNLKPPLPAWISVVEVPSMGDDWLLVSNAAVRALLETPGTISHPRLIEDLRCRERTHDPNP